jgi:N-acyl-D-amino-acid deacylase
MKERAMMQRITRRRFLGETARAVAAASVAGGGLVLNGCSSRKDFDLVIKDGLVYDGLGNPGLVTDIGISRDLIKYLGKISYSRGRAVLEARGLAVAPGFIDVHDHSDVQLLVNPKAESAVHQGITTTISGNCGSSPFPIADEIFEQEKDSLKKWYEIDLTWRDIQGFFSRIEEKGIALNYGTLVGQGAIRGAAMGFNDRAPKPAELEKMKALVSENLKNGALGLSSGLEYTPGSFAQPDELVELCKIVALAGGVYATHMRDEGDALIESLMETIDVAKKSGVSVQISHLKVAYPRNWGKINAAIVKIEEAKKDGVDIFCDRYPYIAGATSLDFNFPLWARQGTTEEFLSRLKDPYQDAKLRSYIAEREKKLESWDKVVISYVLTEKNRKFEGKNILEASREAGKPPYEFMRDLLIEENDQVGIVIFMMKEENLSRILAHPLVGIGTDGEARAPYGLLGRGKPHPRVYGTFPRAIGKYVRDEKLLKLEEMLKKMTSFPAKKFGLQKRGVVRAENIADLVIFDPDKIIDKATWKEPHQYPAGVEYVLVNGEIVIDKGSHTGKLPGKILRKKSAL